MFLHERDDFTALIETVANSESINNPSLVEKDYWLMHVLYGLKQQGLTFELKGGTSLSKGFGIIHRFSEDVDIRIEPLQDQLVYTSPNHKKPAHIESRRKYFDMLRENIAIPGITDIERDTAFDDQLLRNAGIRLNYDSRFGSIPGLKDGILLEAGFDKTTPNQPRNISSWAVDFAESRGLSYNDNRAYEIPCYLPEYTFVEKLQAVVKKYEAFKETRRLSPNFLRHYYDIHQLLELERVRDFIGSKEYLEHKSDRFKSQSHDLAESDAFYILNPELRQLLEAEYKKTAPLYYRGQTSFDEILERIQRDLVRL